MMELNVWICYQFLTESSIPSYSSVVTGVSFVPCSDVGPRLAAGSNADICLIYVDISVIIL